MARLDGKVVLISGTGGGQGRAAALEFAAAGARVVGCDVKAEGAEETVQMVREQGGEMISLHPLDLGDMAGAEQWVQAAVSEFGGIDILYNNAGRLHGRAVFGETTMEDWNNSFRDELTLIYTSTRAAWPHLIARGGGVVICTGSIAGFLETTPQHTPFHGMSKAGVVAFSRMLAFEGAPHNIRSVSLSPGLIRSPTVMQMWNKETGQVNAVGQAVLNKIPMGRAGECEEIAKVAVFLASDDASYINATDLRVDGGWGGVAFTPA